MNGFAKAMTADRHASKRRRAPKGFDILLADAMLKFNMNQEQINTLGKMTYNNEIAHATRGNEVYYRTETLQRLFG